MSGDELGHQLHFPDQDIVERFPFHQGGSSPSTAGDASCYLPHVNMAATPAPAAPSQIKSPYRGLCDDSTELESGRSCLPRRIDSPRPWFSLLGGSRQTRCSTCGGAPFTGATPRVPAVTGETLTDANERRRREELQRSCGVGGGESRTLPPTNTPPSGEQPAVGAPGARQQSPGTVVFLIL